MKLKNIAGVDIDLMVLGDGPPLLYLHPEHYFNRFKPFIKLLSANKKVYIPRHPGFNGDQPPRDFRNVGDLAYLYLDLINELDISEVTLLGASFGGWIALEMAIRDCSRLNSIALIAPLGAKFSAHDERDFADLFALPEDEVNRALFAGQHPDLGTFSTDELMAAARDRQFIAYYAWKPYLHNPSLGRWLHRITVPTKLIWGELDGFVTPNYGKNLADRIPRAQLEVIPKAGHYPQLEQPEATMALL